MRTLKSGVLGAAARAVKSSETCRLETLARSHALHVQRCSHCQTLSLHFGPLTVRFDAETVESVWNTLGQALITLHTLRAQDEETVNQGAPESSN